MSASVILRELGGYPFQITVNARDFAYPQDGISFRMAREARGIDRVTITKTATGFTMRFFQGDTQVTAVEDVEQRQLRATFARHTGLM